MSRRKKKQKQKTIGSPAEAPAEPKTGNTGSAPSDEDVEDLIRTKGKEALEEIARLAMESDLKEELKVRCLLYLADLWAKDARKKLESASDFDATLADIARRAAEEYEKKYRQRKSGQGG